MEICQGLYGQQRQHSSPQAPQFVGAAEDPQQVDGTGPLFQPSQVLGADQ